MAFAQKVDAGVDYHQHQQVSAAGREEWEREALKPPPRRKIEAQLKRLERFKAGRDQAAVRRALDTLARAAESENDNVFEKVVDAACAGVTHGKSAPSCARSMASARH